MNREVVIKLFKKVARILEDDKEYDWLAEEVKDYLNEMYVDEELGVKPKQEPEAWILKETVTGYKTQVAWRPSVLKKGWVAIPLYAGSPTCEPLNDEQLLDERIRQIMLGNNADD